METDSLEKREGSKPERLGGQDKKHITKQSWADKINIVFAFHIFFLLHLMS